MSSFKTILVEESSIADLSSEETFGVYSGAAEKTLQKFLATSASNSSLIWNIQVPSENIVVSRHPLMQSDINFTISIGNPLAPVPNGQLAFDLGSTDALQCFPLQSLFTNYSVMVNNTSITSNLQDILPQITQMYDKRQLTRFNSTTPSLPDNSLGLYGNMVGSNNNVLGSVYDMSYDSDFSPRGAFALRGCFPARFLGGVYQDNSLISTGAANETWKIYVFATVTEPFLALSPFVDLNADNSSGLIGVNTITLTANIDATCKRLWSTANYDLVGTALQPFITGIQLGTSGAPGGAGVLSTSPNGFENTYLLMEFLSLQPSQASRMSSKCVVPYMDYPRYITPSSNLSTILTGATTSLTSQNIQLNSVPDLFIICVRQQMSTQSWQNTSGFLTINNVSINFNNKSGVLASANPQQLFNLSSKNGSCQTWQEFSGSYYGNTPAGAGTQLSSLGSLLVLNPSLDFGLDDFLSASSLGQFNFMITLSVTNQYAYSVQPEIVVITANSGLFICEAGVSQTYQGILSKQAVLDAKSGKPTIDTKQYERLIGGRMSSRGMGRVLKMFHKHATHPSHHMSGGSVIGGAHHHVAHHKKHHAGKLHKHL
jgi:hypothetical protein